MLKTLLLTIALTTGAAAAAPTTAPPPAPKAPPASVVPLAAKAVTPPPVAAQSGRVARTTDLRDQPANDGAMLRVVAANTAIEVGERKGGWYKVNVEGTAGWMRLSAVRFGSPNAVAASGGSSSPLKFLQSGRSAVTTGTVTTGVRGLSEEDLSKAEPNYAAVAALDQFAVTADDSRAFASELPAAATSVDFVKPPDPKDKKRKGKHDGGDR
jgi:hypothetical protein